MLFPWDKYEELELSRRNTLQVFVTNNCNLNCDGCFARKAMATDKSGNMTLDEYIKVIADFQRRGGEQINILGGEPLLHPNITDMTTINSEQGIKTTIYTNGYFIDRFTRLDFHGAKLRVSIYSKSGKTKSLDRLPPTELEFDTCFMVSRGTTTQELLESARVLEGEYNCPVFFISSIRELDNPRKEFFDDTDLSMPVLKYKELVHEFLRAYTGSMEIHISKRGVFESTKTLADTRCRFANYLADSRIVQCPYDLINEKFQPDYSFGTRSCQQNSTCLMSKIVLRRK